ncbi:hypothetical protein BD770DRAFT_446206 [Pilaira anomala]|nr:hypothetical protein BD770DRAFT_446206 [Pilaira anomala]
MQAMWDVFSTYIKYTEGFIVYEGNIISKPFELWSATHKKNMIAMDYIECVTFSLQVGVFCLMQSFWNYLSNTVARKSFMGSFEFKFYIVWALLSMAMFPILQWVYRNDITKREGVPQLAYGVEALAAALLGIRSHFRFKRIIGLSQKNNGASNKAIVTRLAYFKDMNALVSIILFFYAISFIILCVDGLTETRIINKSKFATDTIIANANICIVFLWLLLISIFHPRPQYSRNANDITSTNNNSSFQYTAGNTLPTSHVETTGGRAQMYPINETVRGTIEEGSKFTATGGGASGMNNNGGFMRAMSPVTVDYPHSLTNDTIPLTSSASGRPLSPPDNHHHHQVTASRNMAIEDPYSNQPVMFSMMDVSSKQQQQQQQQRYVTSPTSPTSMSRHDIPLRGMNSMDSRSNTMSPQMNRYADEDEYMGYAPDHMKQTTVPGRMRRPSWERKEEDMSLPSSPQQQQQQQNISGQPGDQMVRDWLWQSPDRRNP